MKKKKTNIKTEKEKQEESKAGTVFVIFLIVVLIVAFLRIYRAQWLKENYSQNTTVVSQTVSLEEKA